jgi:NAD(P)-dependent dehydrogenase (short-subunit alcohol dehydrogenase family)
MKTIGPEHEHEMHDKICLVTGATSGIGAVTARQLAERGATVMVVGRNAQKCEETVRTIRHQTKNDQVGFLVADLARQRAIHELAESFKRQYPRLDVLVNNAGGLFMTRQESPDGIELTFALNHLSYFLLTHLLMESLRQAPAARIINVSSNAHFKARLNFDDLEAKSGYSGFAVYGRSKLANLLFTYELARRLQGSGMTTNALHPGLVATNFATNNGWLTRWVMRLIVHRFAASPEEGARTPVYLATAKEVDGVSGCYFVQEQPVHSAPDSYDLLAAERLWQVSEQLTGISSAEFGLQPLEAELALG